jgi:hypothetical protein
MNRNRNYDKRQKAQNMDAKGKKGKNSPKKRTDEQVRDRSPRFGDEKIERDNNPAWYFTDSGVADQVSRLSIRNFLGRSLQLKNSPFSSNVTDVTITPIYSALMMPSAGSGMSNPGILKNAGINQSGFRLYTKLAAFTGRALTYAPQDISIMVLAMGEIISTIEFIRRAFGVAYTYNQRNRVYPRAVIRSMGIDPDNMFENFSRYRNEFNKLVTRVNQIPIPKNIAYFDKCASLYEKLYLDSDSPMAQTVITVPFKTWTLDESVSDQGSVLVTTDFADPNSPKTVYQLLTIIGSMVDALLESSTLNVVYADILNYFNKVGGEVWLFDYLTDGYTVVPEFNIKFMMQLHNATMVGVPSYTTFELVDGVNFMTPNNDVYSNATYNSVIYSPAWSDGVISSHTPEDLVVDFETANPTPEDIIENTRFTVLTGHLRAKTGWLSGATLPDHYIAAMLITDNDGKVETAVYTTQDTADTPANLLSVSHALTKLDWAPLHYYAVIKDNALKYGKNIVGDINFYTTIDRNYLRPVDDFVTLALYDFR